MYVLKLYLLIMWLSNCARLNICEHIHSTCKISTLLKDISKATYLLRNVGAWTILIFVCAADHEISCSLQGLGVMQC